MPRWRTPTTQTARECALVARWDFKAFSTRRAQRSFSV